MPDRPPAEFEVEGRMGIKRDRQGNEDDRLQRDLLALVLVEHPVPVTLSEAQRTLGQPPEVERALAALVAAGLLTLKGEDVAATPAAIRFNEIEPIEPPGAG
jgi:hypothetical protein